MALASFFDGDFSVDWLEALTRSRATPILLALEAGVEKGILERGEPGVYRFVDRKEQQGLRSQFSPQTGERLHREICNILLMEPIESDKKARALSRHMLHITNDLNGCEWLKKAGDAFCKTFEDQNALESYEKAIEDLQGIRGTQADSLFVETAIGFSKLPMGIHETESALSILQEALKRSIASDHKANQALLKMHMAKNEWLLARYRDAFRHFEEGWSLAQTLDDTELLGKTRVFSTFFSYWQGRYQAVIENYEKYRPAIDRSPRGRFHPLVSAVAGHCYVGTGRVSQGVGILDALRVHSHERRDSQREANAMWLLGAAMFDIRRIEEAVQYWEAVLGMEGQMQIGFPPIAARLGLAAAHCLCNEEEKATTRLREFLERSERIQMVNWPLPFLLDLCWAQEQGKFQKIPDLSLHKEINQGIRRGNIFLKGVSYRYQALLQRREGQPPHKVLKTLRLSHKWLKESGAQLELGKTVFEMAREHLKEGQKEKASEVIGGVVETLSAINEALIPEDLRPLIREGDTCQADVLREVLELGRGLVTVREQGDLVHKILSTANRIMSTERGALFRLNGEGDLSSLKLIASKNLTRAHVEHPSFEPSMKIIEAVARSGKTRVMALGSAKSSKNHQISCICVPLILRGRIVGVLYHDNRVLKSSFQKSDCQLLELFAALSAFALENVNAFEEIRTVVKRLEEEREYYQEQYLKTAHSANIIGESKAIRNVIAQVTQVAQTDTTVLVLGETGVGKELIAQEVHRRSPRKDKPFVSVQCSALPESLIPSEFFGHEKGAFTGAVQRRIGRFELANEGTIFLDEIGGLPLDVQVRLLRILQSKEFERIGGSTTLRSDFRAIAATNMDLESEMRTNRFRADLYYRLNVFPVHVPPLRERKEDIPLLADYFLNLYSRKMAKRLDGFSEQSLDRLIQYEWPGNIRELKSIIERSVILSQGPIVHIPELGASRSPAPPSQRDYLTLRENERRHILAVLQRTHWKVGGRGGAAELLDIPPSTLAFRMKKLGIERPQEK